MAEVNINTIRSEGRRARLRAQERSGSGRISEAAWYPELDLLRQKGRTQAQISMGTGLSERRIREIFQWGRDGQSMLREIPVARALSDLTTDARAMLEPTAEAFEAFYNTFAGYTLPAHCREWIEAFFAERNLMLNVPPRHNKSTIFSVWLPIWLLTQDRNEQIILISQARDLSQGFANAIAFELELNEGLISTYGRYAPERMGDIPWRPLRGELMILGRTKEGKSGQLSVQSRGSQQTILGKEATVLIVDDVTNAERARSETERNSELRWLQEQAFTRIQPSGFTNMSGHAVVVGQRVDYRDLYGDLARQTYTRGDRKGEPLWHVITYPAIKRWPDEDPQNPEAEVLWPELMPFEELMVSYERIGGHNVFECMYQQNPLPEEARLVRPEWWDGCRDYDRVGGHGPRSDISGESQGFLPIVRVLSVDPGLSGYSAAVIADVLFSRTNFAASLVELRRWRGGARELTNTTAELAYRFDPDYIIFEHSASSYHVQQSPDFEALRRRFRIIGHNTGKNKHDPELGVSSLAGDIELGKLRLPWGDEYGRDMSKLFMDEANVWPFGDTDDVLMAVWFIKAQWRALLPQGALPTVFSGHKAGEGWGWRSDLRRSRGIDDTVKKYRKDRDNARRQRAG